MEYYDPMERNCPWCRRIRPFDKEEGEALG